MNKVNPPLATDPVMLELYRLLLQSEKFLAWKPEEEAEKPFTLEACHSVTSDVDGTVKAPIATSV
jgi:hypothetical protein